MDLPPAEVRSRFAADVGHVTPKVSAGAAIFDEMGRVFLQRPADDGTWGLPGGYAEPNEAPPETAARETREETGLDVEPGELVVYTRRHGEYGPRCLVVHVYRCTSVGGTVEVSIVAGGTIEVSIEGVDVRYWSLDDVPGWHENHDQQARDAHDVWRGLE